MALRLYEASDAIKTENVVIHVYADPGIGRTTLGNEAAGSVVADFDDGIHRSLGRKDAFRFDAWSDLEELLAHPKFLGAGTLVIDTVGRALELLADEIIAGDAKLGSPLSDLNQRGWGVLKTRFIAFFAALRSMKKDVVLLSHAKIDKDKDGSKTAVPDISGGSAGEVFKVSDAMAYYSMVGGKRVLDFNVTEQHVGKNPPGWNPMVVPDYAKDPTWFAVSVIQALKAHLNTLSEEQTVVLKEVADWSAFVDEIPATPEAFTAATAKLNTIPRESVKAQIRTIFGRRAKALGFEWDKEARAYRAKVVQISDGKKPDAVVEPPQATEPDPDAAGDAVEDAPSETDPTLLQNAPGANVADPKPTDAPKASRRRAGLT